MIQVFIDRAGKNISASRQMGIAAGQTDFAGPAAAR
jgi:hypothetical protein